MGTARNNQMELKLPLLEKPKTLKNYSQPEVLRHTFETLSNLHKLLPNHLMELLHSYKSEEDKKKCMWAEGGRQRSGRPALYRGAHAPSGLVHAKSLQSCLTLCDPVDHSPPGSSVSGTLQQEYWSGLPCPPPGDLPDPGIEPTTCIAGGFFTTSAAWEAPLQS